MKVNRIVFATDFSLASQEALEYAKTLATSLRASIDLLHVFDHRLLLEPVPYFPVAVDSTAEYLSQGREKAKEAVRELCEKMELECDIHLLEGNPAKEIVDFVEQNEVDLLIMGSHGYTGLSRWLLGSVAEYVVRHANCPVLTVKQRSQEEEKT